MSKPSSACASYPACAFAVKIKAHELRTKSKAELLKQLDELKTELSQVMRVMKDRNVAGRVRTDCA
jgi:hypothetical protein